MHAPGTAERSALRGDIGLAREPRALQPQGQAGVQAACHRILRHTQGRHKGPHLELALGTGRISPHHTELEALHCCEVGLQRQHGGSIGQPRGQPAGAVVHPDEVEQRLGRQPQRGQHLGAQRGVVDRAAALQWRRGKGQPLAISLHTHQADGALLHHLAGLFGIAAAGQEGMGAAQRRVARERQFATRREDAHPIVSGRVGGRQQEGGFAEVGPAGEGGHFLVGQTGSVDNDGQRVALQRGRGEDVDLDEAAEFRHRAGTSGTDQAARSPGRGPASPAAGNRGEHRGDGRLA
mmetsp:Transcript_5523/g.13340  ORF Transcript_5523/g.13340 Transcript_5523/m.13340 type:complete len:293 (+) Transcript_5523:495-1373(+)